MLIQETGIFQAKANHAPPTRAFGWMTLGGNYVKKRGGHGRQARKPGQGLSRHVL